MKYLINEKQTNIHGKNENKEYNIHNSCNRCCGLPLKVNFEFENI